MSSISLHKFVEWIKILEQVLVKQLFLSSLIFFLRIENKKSTPRAVLLDSEISYE